MKQANVLYQSVYRNFLKRPLLNIRDRLTKSSVTSL